ncbi:MAG TPA: DUF4403 family protein [Cyclobacteriaceae bacterium]|nr:DUF4403 family protein [Cyclobacteriaceae bacterium]
MKYSSIFIIAIFIFFSCKRINPDRPAYSGETLPLPEAQSTINVPLEIPLAYIEKHLNKSLAELIYAEDALNIGNGLTTQLEVFRTGSLKLSSNAQNKLLVNLPMRLKGKLQIQKSIFGQSLATSIPYDEQLSPVVSFSPEIGRNWDVAINDLKIESWGRSLRYDLLGYEIDLDPILRKHVEAMLKNQLSSNGLSRISFKNLVTETWKAYGKPFQIGQGELETYVYTVPQKIKISEQITQNNTLKLNLGLEGRVMTYLGDKPQVKEQPLPNLYHNEDNSNRIDITLPIAISYTTLDEYLNKEIAGQNFKFDAQNNFIPKAISTQSYGDRTLVQMDFTLIRSGRKDLTGKLYLVGKPTFDAEREAIRFDDIDFDINSKNILANNASWLKQGQLLAALEKHAFIPIGSYVDQARTELQQRGYLSTDFASFRVVRPELKVQNIFVTESDVRIYLNAKGQMEIQLSHPEALID